MSLLNSFFEKIDHQHLKRLKFLIIDSLILHPTSKCRTSKDCWSKLDTFRDSFENTTSQYLKHAEKLGVKILWIASPEIGKSSKRTSVQNEVMAKYGRFCISEFLSRFFVAIFMNKVVHNIYFLSSRNRNRIKKY